MAMLFVFMHPHAGVSLTHVCASKVDPSTMTWAFMSMPSLKNPELKEPETEKSKSKPKRKAKPARRAGQVAFQDDAVPEAPVEPPAVEASVEPLAVEGEEAVDAEERPKRKSKGKARKAHKARKNAFYEAVKVEGDPAFADAASDEANEMEPDARPEAASKKGSQKRTRSGAKVKKSTPEEDGQDPLGERFPLPEGFVYPPEWVTANNVYTNLYRRLKKAGNAMDVVKEEAREARYQFSVHGGVPMALVSSFGIAKRGPKKPKLGQEAFVNNDDFLMGNNHEPVRPNPES